MRLVRFLFFTLSFFTGFVVASKADAGQIDLSLWGDYRSFPVSGVAEAVVGYDQLLWGSEKDALYGFVRVFGEFDAITQYQGTTLKAELFPISILGVRLGQGWSQNHLDLSSFDCGKDLCRGFYSQNFIEGQTYLGLGPIKFSGSYRYINLKLDQASVAGFTNYIDPDSGLEFVTATNDHQWRARGLLAYEFNKNWRFGYALSRFGSDSTNEIAQQWMLFTQGTFGSISITVGGGEYYSSILTSRSSIVAIGQWTLYPHLGY